MPSMISPPVKPPRSPMKRSSGIHSTWESPFAAPPVPPLPSSPAMFSPNAIPPSPMSRSSSASSGSSRISTPPLSRRRSSSRLLPALPLAQTTPKMKRVAVDYSGLEGVQIVVSEEEYGTPARTPVSGYDRSGSARRKVRSPRLEEVEVINFGKVDDNEGDGDEECLGKSYQEYSSRRDVVYPPQHTYLESQSTPPRPARRAPSPLLPPQLPFARASSPSDSLSSQATTPRAERPPSRQLTEPASLPMGRKRDSAQRRLSALRGLVGHLDFNQPWSVAEKVDGIHEEKAEDFVWACGEEPEVIPVPIPVPRVRRMTVSQDHGWDKEELPPRNESLTTPRRNSILRKPNSTPPRRNKAFRTSDLRTPEPRPKQRTEIFEVASGGYSKSIEPAVSPLPTTPTSTWRSSLPNDEIFHRVAASGPIEVKRQEIIWEMCETEHAFVKSMRTVLRLFAIPLKTPQGKWIDGIPSRITELFDSLERIAHAHGVVSASQRDMRRRNDVMDVASLVSMFRSWVHRLEVHETYLLKFEAVVQLVEENVRDPESVFGEFVRMQMKEEVLGSMSLGSMLLKPVQRLTKYPLFLKRLLDATPHPHPAHTEILALLSTTESIILTLQATKAREDDLEQLRLLEARLHGLPEGFTLAVRGRKLIGHGQVVRVQNNLPRRQSSHSSRGSISSAVSSGASSSPWEILTPSRSSAFSTSSTSSFGRSNSLSSPSTSPGRVTRSPSTVSSLGEGSIRRKKEEVLTMLVFDDLVIIASGAGEKSGLFSSGKKKGEKGWKILSEAEGGIGKVADVRDWTGWQGDGPIFPLTLLPLASTPRNPLPGITTAFALPNSSSPRGTKTPALSGTSLTSLQGFMTVLTQATASVGIMSKYVVEDSEILRGEEEEWQGYAQ